VGGREALRGKICSGVIMNGFLGNENAPGMNTEMARKAFDVLSIAKHQLLGVV
jgi:hypothetical protein